MRQDRDGVWRATVDLPCGSRSEFRYLIDGQWKTDYHADGFTTNVYGTDNSFIEATLPDKVLTLERKTSQVWDSALRNYSPATPSRQLATQLSRSHTLSSQAKHVKAHVVSCAQG
jgi:hypothetical protein